MVIKILVLWCFLISMNLFGQITPDDLINFDEKSSRSYLKKHRVLSASLDSIINFGHIDRGVNTVWLKDVKANFTTLVPHSGLSLVHKELPWMHPWLKEHKELRVYFWMNDLTGTPELVGYSKDIIEFPKIRKKLLDNEQDTFVDFSSVDPSAFSGTYIRGRLDGSERMTVFTLLYKKNLLLIYPEHLWGAPKISTFADRYKLVKPISVGLLEKIVQEDIFLVLKKVNHQYEICGYVGSEGK